MHRSLIPLAAAFLATPALAAPVKYAVEPGHTYPSFKAQHMGISFWRGKFNKNSGSVVLDREARTGSVDINIDATSVDFGHDKMNEHAQKEDFFNTAKYPTITYTGTITFEGDQPSGVDGQLTMLGVTQPVKLVIDSFKCVEHKFYKREVCGADASGAFNRWDFGMKYGAPTREDGQAEIGIQIEALREG